MITFTVSTVQGRWIYGATRGKNSSPLPLGKLNRDSRRRVPIDRRFFKIQNELVLDNDRVNGTRIIRAYNSDKGAEKKKKKCSVSYL